jgi:hypothetical protein
MLLRCARKVIDLLMLYVKRGGGCFAAEKAARKALLLLGWVCFARKVVMLILLRLGSG